MSGSMLRPPRQAGTGAGGARDRFGNAASPQTRAAADAGAHAHRIGQAAELVWSALGGVADPELDQSIVDLGFVAAVTVADDGEAAAVVLRLPTFWCSANFAWIMAEDARLALRGVPGLRRSDIRLVDHFAADRINLGIAGGLSFRETFGGEAGGDLGELRATFRRKAFLGRMSALIEALRERGWSDQEIVTAPIAALAATRGDPLLAPRVGRYLDLRAFFGGSCRPDELAFRTVDGDPIAATALGAHLRNIRLTRRSVEANGEMCRILLAERIRDPRSCGEEKAGGPTGCTPPPGCSVPV